MMVVRSGIGLSSDSSVGHFGASRRPRIARLPSRHHQNYTNVTYSECETCFHRIRAMAISRFSVEGVNQLQQFRALQQIIHPVLENLFPRLAEFAGKFTVGKGVVVAHRKTALCELLRRYDLC